MKLTELKCPNCNAILKLSEENPQIAVCEFCKMQYLIEIEKGGGTHLNPQGRQTWYTKIEPVKVPEKKENGWEAYGWKRILVCSFLGILLLIVIRLPYILANRKPPKETDTKTELANQVEYNEITPTQAERYSSEELSKIRWLSLIFENDQIQIGYSLEDPLVNSNATLIYEKYQRTDNPVDLTKLFRLTGLKRLEINQSIPKGALKGLTLTSLSCRCNSFTELAELLDAPEELLELTITSGLEQLNGLDKFSGLQSLVIENGRNLTELKELAYLPGLKSLTLLSCHSATDFSVLSVLTRLTELTIESKYLKGTGFLNYLPELTKLSVLDGDMLRLEGLNKLQNLTSLTIQKIKNLQSLEGIETLTNLSELTVTIPYSCEPPKLKNLVKLKHLSISGMKDTSFLRTMDKLERLEMSSCEIRKPEDFAQLTSLKTLQLKNLSGAVNGFSFLNYLTALETLNMQGMTTYEDITVIFSLPSVKTLLISGLEGAIRIADIKHNPVLTTLKMDGVSFYTNVKISYEGAFTYVDYDPVTVADHLEVLNYFINLEELSLAENKLTSIAPLSELSRLKRLNIQDNYISDLAPLASIETLKEVICTGNMIDNYRVLNDSVTIIKE